MLVFRVTDRVVEVDETQNLIGYNSDYTAEFSYSLTRSATHTN